MLRASSNAAGPQISLCTVLRESLCCWHASISVPVHHKVFMAQRYRSVLLQVENSTQTWGMQGSKLRKLEFSHEISLDRHLLLRKLSLELQWHGVNLALWVSTLHLELPTLLRWKDKPRSQLGARGGEGWIYVLFFFFPKADKELSHPGNNTVAIIDNTRKRKAL